jgi:hypothetical protein
LADVDDEQLRRGRGSLSREGTRRRGGGASREKERAEPREEAKPRYSVGPVDGLWA